MVKSFTPNRRRGALTTELVIAISLLAIALIPIAYAVVQERELASRYYQRAVLMQLIDGELEWLAASRGASAGEGVREYRISALAATNLPPGKFWMIRKGNVLRLEFRAEAKRFNYGHQIELP